MTSYSKRSGNTRGVPSGVGYLRQVCAVLRHGLESRATQAEEVSDEIRRSPYPVILCGDFNEVPLSYAYRILTQGLHDDFQEAGWGSGTSHSDALPWTRIDYIFSSPL